MSTNENLIGGPCKHGGIGVLCHECRIEQLQTENAKLKDEVERLRLLYKDTAIALVRRGGNVNQVDSEKDINKIKADAIRDMISENITVARLRNDQKRAFVFVGDALKHANKVEKGE